MLGKRRRDVALRRLGLCHSQCCEQECGRITAWTLGLRAWNFVCDRGLLQPIVDEIVYASARHRCFELRE
jgi:hypothetical protein